MRTIYLDEAGISPDQPICVVAGLITTIQQSEALKKELHYVKLHFLPKNMLSDGILHATDIFSAKGDIDRYQWSFPARLEFLKEVANLPLRLRIPIIFGSVEKSQTERNMSETLSAWLSNAVGSLPTLNRSKPRYDANSLAHVIAFHHAINRANYYLREVLSEPDTAEIIAENIEKMKLTLSSLGLVHRERPMLGSMQSRKTLFEIQAGIEPPPITYEIKSIVGNPQFVKKG